MKLILRTSLAFIIILLGGSTFTHASSASPIIISRVSAGCAETTPWCTSENPALSGDGRYVVFQSRGPIIVPGDTNDSIDIFRRDTKTGEVVRVSTDSFGNQVTGDSERPAISADGRYVAFESDAATFVGGDTNNWPDIYLKDIDTGIVRRVSTDAAGSGTSMPSNMPSLSADGRFVAFSSWSAFTPDDTNGRVDVFVKDTQTGAIWLVSTDSAGNPSNWDSDFPSLSADGRYVTFASNASNLIVGDTNGTEDIFVKDRQTSATSRVSTNSSGNQSTGNAYFPDISGDGQHVVFMSDSSDLVPGDIDYVWDIFEKNMVSGAISRVSTDSSGNQGTQHTYSGRLSYDGRFVTFSTASANLVDGDTNSTRDVFLKDTQTGVTSMLSRDVAGIQGAGYADNPAISADGRYVAFDSYSRLTPDDTDDYRDIFVTRASPNHAFTWYDDLYGANWVLMANPASAAGDAWFDVSMAGAVQTLPSLAGYVPGQLFPGSTLFARFNGLIGGPVDAGYHSESPVLVSQRILWSGNSLEEVVGTDTRKLSNHFYWTWYDQQSAGFTNWVLVANPSANPVYYRIKIAGETKESGNLAPGQEITPTFSGVMGGPVEVEGWSDAAGGSMPATLMASQRVLSNGGSAFNEVPGTPVSELASDYLWTWYDMTGGVRNWILIANPPTSPDGSPNTSDLYYQIRIGSGAVVSGGPIAPGQNENPTFDGTIGGPVEVRTFSDAAHNTPANSICSQRSLWGPSFEEVPGMRSAALGSSYNWTWYDQNQGPGVTNWVLVANPVTASASIYYELKIGASTVNGGPIGPGQNEIPTFPGVIGGPVSLRSFSDPAHSTPANSIASQRVLWNGFFNEVMGTALE